MTGSLILPMPMFLCMLGKPFHFRGCGWSRKKEVAWSKDDMAWIFTMNDLFKKMFGKDALSYEFDKGLKRVLISPDCLLSISMIMHCGSSSFLQFYQFYFLAGTATKSTSHSSWPPSFQQHWPSQQLFHKPLIKPCH